ncbi:3'(2'),5'-bisphosphate nucleotidase CysQ [Bacillus benzoevorans]|nr:3'(2'),5'-bisphosphate nucleotidase CysQ [Bacillus benzoevorans]
MYENIKLTDLVQISMAAGERILEVYGSDFEVENKEDNSPLTLADKRSNAEIIQQLNHFYPHIPVLSEEVKAVDYQERKQWDCLWIVDPLDGTKEFVKRNGEFTVNIALVCKGTPVIGVIYAPVLDRLYFAKKGVGAFKLEQAKNFNKMNNDNELLEAALRLPYLDNKDKKYVVASRSHMSPETEAYVNRVKEKYGETEVTSIGSSLKLCLVAEGKADVYPRFAPTMEWDTAAGQTIVEQSGGKIVKTADNQPLEYNKENLLNPWFIAMREGFGI